MIRYIFFDLDGTLFDFKKEERNALSKTLTELGITPTDEMLSRYSEINISQWKLLELGKIERAQMKVRRYELLFEEFGIDISGKKATAIYEKHLALSHSFIENAPEILETLYKDYQLYLVTNGSTVVQNGRLDSSCIRKYFKGIYISQEIGVNKPDKRFFDACFSDIKDFDRSQAVIIGDSLSSDIQGGINAGIKTIWFNRRKEQCSDIKPDYEISSLLELSALLPTI